MNIKRLFDRKKEPANILLRDITGECDPDCRDRVREGEVERQHDINLAGVEEIESYPDASWAHVRNVPPGAWGGHV